MILIHKNVIHLIIKIAFIRACYTYIYPFNIIMQNAQMLALRGQEFEKSVHKCMSRLITSRVLSESEIVTTYGSLGKGVDHLIISGNTIVCIQDKWRSMTISVSMMRNFIASALSIKNTKQHETHNLCFIFLSKSSFSPDAKKVMQEEINKGYKFITIESTDQDYIKEKLLEHLHFMSIYQYEHDGSCIMFTGTSNHHIN
jgi:hypothetical protein